MKAMILAAGFGTRLFPLTIDRTKPAIPFLGKPLVGYVAEYLAGFGIRDVIVNLHHQPRSVEAALGNGERYGVRINYSIEDPSILGTAGALDNVRKDLEGSTFVVINGKIITDIDISAAIRSHKDSGALATMVLKPNRGYERFTSVETEGSRITGFGSYPSKGENDAALPLMFTGIQILEPAVFEYIPRGEYSDIVPCFYKPAIESGGHINAFVSDAKWFEMSTMSRYLDISLAMMGSERVFAGNNSMIENGADVTDAVLWDDVTVRPGAKLSRAIVADGVEVPGDVDLSNVAIVRSEMVRSCAERPEKAPAGYEMGDNYIVPLIQ